MITKNLKFLKIFIFFYIIFIMTSCAHFSAHGRSYISAKKSYSYGNYDEAVNSCILSLRYNVNYEPSYNLLRDIFPKTVDYHHKQIDRLKNSRDYFKWDLIVNELEILLKFVDDLESLNFKKIISESNIRNYYKELDEAKILAAESHYQSGKSKMYSSDKNELRDAAIEFKKAISYVFDYKDSQELYNISRESAAIKLGFLPFQNNSGKKKYGDIGKTISNELISRLITDKDLMEFIDIINRDQIDLIIDEQKLSHSGLVDESKSIELGKIAGINMMVIGEITQLIINNPQKTVDKNTLEKSVVSSTTTYTDADGNKRKKNNYKTVKCTVKKYKQTASSKIIGSYQIIDTKTAEILFSNNIEGQYDFNHTWATVRGDKRAMDYSTKILAKKNAGKPPGRDQMVYSALETLIDNFYLEIKSSLK